MLKRLLLIFTIFLLLLAVIGITYTQLAIKKSEHEAIENLQSICRLRADQIYSWMKERDADAFTLKSSANLALRIDEFIQHNKSTDQQILLSHLESLRQAYSYESVLLIDTKANLLMGAGSNLDIPANVKNLLQQTIQNREILHTDLYRENDGHIHLDWIAPIVKNEGKGETVIAAIVLRTDTRSKLFRIIETWPIVSDSAESFLVRQEGYSIVALNELRHRANSALQFKLPLSTKDLPATAALKTRQPGTMRGVDYRGVDVLSAFQPITGTDLANDHEN